MLNRTYKIFQEIYRIHLMNPVKILSILVLVELGLGALVRLHGDFAILHINPET